MATDYLPFDCWLIITRNVEDNPAAYFRLCMTDWRCRRSEMAWRTYLSSDQLGGCYKGKNHVGFSCSDSFICLERINLDGLFPLYGLDPVHELSNNKSNFSIVTSLVLPEAKAMDVEPIIKRMPRLSSLNVKVHHLESLDKHWSFLQAYDKTIRKFVITSRIDHFEEVEKLAEYLPSLESLKIQFYTGSDIPDFRGYLNLKTLHFSSYRDFNLGEIEARLPSSLGFDDFFCCGLLRKGIPFAIECFIIRSIDHLNSNPRLCPVEVFDRRVKKPRDFISEIKRQTAKHCVYSNSDLAQLVHHLVHKNELASMLGIFANSDFPNHLCIHEELMQLEAAYLSRL